MTADDKTLNKTILATIVWFDIFNWPLSLFELWQWMFFKDKRPEKNFSLSEVQAALEQDEFLLMNLSQKNSFYFLKGREGIVKTRQDGQLGVTKKFKRALWVVRLLKNFPFVKMIAVCSHLAYGNATEDSDIDLFVIAQKNRLWTSRFFILSLLKFLRLRPGKEKKDKICISFILADQSLDLKGVRITEPDIDFIFWISRMLPLYDEGVYYDFIKANSWIKDYLPNFIASQPASPRLVRINSLSRFFKKFMELCHSGPLGDILESFYAWFQMNILPARLAELMNRDNRVIVDERMLKFHPTDRRVEYQNKFEQRMKQW